MSGDDLFQNLSLSAPLYNDERGWLSIIYENKGVVLKRSASSIGVLRGLHWQRPPATQEKIIRVVSGEIIDFIAKPDDPEQEIFARRMSPDSGWVRIGGEWAHGFYACKDATFEYLCIGAYDESRETSLNIERVVQSELGVDEVQLSAKDRMAKSFGRRVIWIEGR